MRIQSIPVARLSEDQLKRCRELSLGDEGYMCDDLDYILEYEQGRYRRSTALLLSIDDKVCGWALVQPIYRRRKWSAQLFVDPGYRGLGLGRRLLEEVNYRYGRPLCHVDEYNEGFFRRYPNMHDRYDEALLV